MSEEATLAQLRQSLGLLQVAFDAAAEAMVIIEPGGEVRWGNQAAADLWSNGLAIMLVGQRLEQLLQNITSISGVKLAVDAAEHPLRGLWHCWSVAAIGVAAYSAAWRWLFVAVGA
jgi:PAS domain-containing protein